MGLIKRGYAAAENIARYGDIKDSRGSGDYEIRSALATVRAKARFLARNSSAMRRFLSLMRINVVGENGLRLDCRLKRQDGQLDRSVIDRLTESWEQWCESPSVCGQMDMIDVQNLIVTTLLRDGEVIIQMVRGREYTDGVAINVLEADHLDETLTNDKTKMGIERDANERVVAYHLLQDHPGDQTMITPSARSRYVRVPASDILHIYMKDRPSQIRGEPLAASVILATQMLDGYREAETMGRRLRSALMGFFKRTQAGSQSISELADSVADDDVYEMGMEPGMLKELPPGMEFQGFIPDDSKGDFAEFEKQAKKEIAMGLGISTMSLGMEVEGVSYSSGRSVIMEDRDYYRVIQSYLSRKVMVPIFRRWVDAQSLSDNSVPATKVASVKRSTKFRARGWGWVDPAKDVRANAEALATGQTSLGRIAAERGMTLEELLSDIKRDQDVAASMGLTLNHTSDNGDTNDEQIEQD